MTFQPRQIFSTIKHLVSNWQENASFSLPKNQTAWIVGILSFIITLTGIFISFERISIIRHLKAEILKTQQNINEVGWDIAYDNIRFDMMLFAPIAQAKNFSIYHKETGTNIIFPELNISTAPFSNNKFIISMGQKQEFTHKGITYAITSKNINLELEIADGKIKQWLSEISSAHIKNIANIQSINLAGRQTSGSLAINGPESVFENHLDIKGIKLNKNLKHPLGNMIDRIYLKTDTIKAMASGTSLKQKLYNWNNSGGHINVANLLVNWDPFSLAGKGEVYLDDTLSPKIQLETSSKGLLSLLNEMYEHEMANRKGLFVANIMLANKAFKLNEKDSELTIVTPITYYKGDIMIDNISIGKL